MSSLRIDRLSSQVLRSSKIRGVQLAIVVDNKPDEANAGYHVKLKFPWLNEQETTFWARIAVPMAGSGRGTFVLPEIDDQVLVVFEHGDINRPIVIGALWSKQQQPVEVNQSGKNNTKLIKSRSGHRIIFDDKEGAEKIVITDSSGRNKIVLDSATKLVQVESCGDIEVKARTNVIIHGNALKVGTKEGITGKSSSLLVHAQKTFGLKATSKITIGGGNTTINTSNAAACSVSGSGAGELGGVAAEQAKDQVPDPIRSHASTAGVGRSPSSGASGPASTPARSPDVELTYIELKLVGPDGKPVAFASYSVTASDGVVFSGIVDASGCARIDGIARGSCEVAFPEFHGEDWRLAA